MATSSGRRAAIALTHAAMGRKSLADMPGPSSWPLVGTLSFFKFSQASVEKYHEDLLAMYKEYGPLFKEVRPLGQTVVHVFDPEHVRQTFLSDGKRPFIVPLQTTTQKYREFRGMNPGLGNLNGEEWYRLRSAVSQAMMKPDAVHEYLPHVNETAGRLVDHISENADSNGEVDMRIVAGRQVASLNRKWSLESAGMIVFEKRLGAMQENVHWADRMVDINRNIFRLSARMKFTPPVYHYVPTPGWRKVVKLEDQFYWEVDKLSTEAIDKLTASTNEQTIIKFASKLINKKSLNTNDIKTILLSLFSDGLSTTSPTLIYNLYLLARNPIAQETLRNELIEVNPNREDWTPILLNKVPFLRACVKEAFRMLTITTEISRIPQKDFVLGEYEIPAGTPIEMHTSLLLRTSEMFTDADTFKPERWLREKKEKEDRQSFLMIPFGHGPRMCAGRRFAEQDLLVVLARLVSAFEIQHNHDDIGQIYETLLMPSGDCRMRFIPV